MLRKRTMLVSQIEDGGGNDVNCKLLMHLDNNRTDSSSSAFSISQYSTIPFTSTYKKFGTYALNCTKAYYSLPDNCFSTLVMSDFTIDYWVKVGVASRYDIPDVALQCFFANTAFIAVGVYTGNIRIFAKGLDANSQLITIDNTIAISLGTIFNHVAVVRHNDVLKVFVNGNKISEIAFAAVAFYNTGYQSINKIAGGCAIDTTGGGVYNNNILDEIRISDCARWTKNFTPPIAAYV